MYKHSPQTPEKKEETKSMVDNLAVLGSVKNPQHMRIADEILTKSLQQRNEFFKSRHTFKDVFVWNQESKVSVNGRSSHTAIVYNDKLYVFGGMDNQYPNQFYCSDDLLIYDISKYSHILKGLEIYKFKFREIYMAEPEKSQNKPATIKVSFRTICSCKCVSWKQSLYFWGPQDIKTKSLLE